MENEVTNPYQAPKSSVDNTISKGGLGGIFDRLSAWAVFGLSIITIGIYPAYWLYTRTLHLNEHVENPISSSFLFTAVGTYSIGLGGNFGPLLGLDETVAAMLSVCGLVGSIMFVVLAFKLRNRIHEHINASRENSTWFSAALTFFLSSLYLQYKINSIIDTE